MMAALIRLIIGIVIFVGMFSAAALLTWFERRLLAGFQDRLGPNRVGPLGLFQPVADGIKLLFKEDWIPPFADKFVFVLSPAILVISILLAFAVVPFTETIKLVDSSVGLLFFLAMSSLSVYSIVWAGWASNSKYSLLGCMRGAAQMISYELPMALSFVGVVMLADSLRLSDIVHAQRHLWFIVTQPLGFVIFLIVGLAEARRTPFDLSEAESELVAGFHTEYSSMKFAMIFLGDYLDLILISMMTVVLFLGGWYGPLLPGLIWFLGKTTVMVSLFIAIRAVLPRFRYDQLIDFGWKRLLPLSILNIIITGAIALALKH